MKFYGLVSDFIDSPRESGVSYALDFFGDGVVIQKIISDSGGPPRYFAFEDADPDLPWEPWARVPVVGKWLGECRVRERKHRVPLEEYKRVNNSDGFVHS